MTSDPILPSRPQISRDLALLNLLVIALAVPFLGQPFHMDDNFYMDMARHALKEPLYPNDTPYVFEGRYLPDMGSHSHPPLQTYFLAAIQRLAGEGAGKEWIYHTCALIYPLLAVTSMYFLCARLVTRPLWPSLALIFCPVFMVMGHTLMTDLPTLSLWLAGVSSFVWATDLRSGRLYAASGLFQFLAMFTSYQSALATPLLASYLLRKNSGVGLRGGSAPPARTLRALAKLAFGRRPSKHTLLMHLGGSPENDGLLSEKGRSAGWLALAAPVLAMAGWFALNYVHYHRFLLVDTAGFTASRRSLFVETILTKFLATLQYQGWLIIFPVFLLCVFARGLRGRLLALAALGSLYGAFAAVPGYRTVDKAIFIVGLTAGLFVAGSMGSLMVQSVRRRAMHLPFDRIESQFLGFWYLAGLATCLLLFVEGSARYVLILVPPVLIVFFRRLELIEIREYRNPARPLLSAGATASGSVVLTLAWGLVLSHADLEFARHYPRMAEDFARTAGSLPKFYGGEWGFRYYMSRAGIEQLPVDESSVRGGSIIALPNLALPYDLIAALRGMTVPLSEVSYSSRSPVKIMDREVPAGFYSTGWGLIPFSFSMKESERLAVHQVDYFVAELPFARVEGDFSVQPWPGYLSLGGRTLLALMVEPGTTVKYPWNLDVPAVISLACGLSTAQSGYDGNQSFEFRVIQRGPRGEILAVDSAVPGGDWRRLELPLKAHGEGGRSLELLFTSRGGAGRAVGAFAAPKLEAR